MVSSRSHTYRVTSLTSRRFIKPKKKLLEIEKKFNIHADIPYLVFFLIVACLYCNIHSIEIYVFSSASKCFFYHTHKIIMLRDFQFCEFVVPTGAKTQYFVLRYCFRLPVASRIFKSWVFNTMKYILLGMFTKNISKFWTSKKQITSCAIIYTEGSITLATFE